MQLPFHLTSEQETTIAERLSEFAEVRRAHNEIWFSELCFCLLTANAQAQKAINIQKEIGPHGFINYSLEKITDIIYKHRHRFHNKKAEFIVSARAHSDIKYQLCEMNTTEAREFLVTNIKGMGYKEASHFLRNVGYNDCAIIDRHILRFMLHNKLIDEIPKTITVKNYLAFEEILKKFGKPLDEVDLRIWCHMTGSVLK